MFRTRLANPKFLGERRKYITFACVEINVFKQIVLKINKITFELRIVRYNIVVNLYRGSNQIIKKKVKVILII